jgi:hypothetical protein
VADDDGLDTRFRVVDLSELSDLMTKGAPPVQWAWTGYIPGGFVTLLSGHGGAGKSIFALHLAVCVALGLPAFGRPAGMDMQRVLYYSAEDPPDLVMARLATICRALNVDPREVAEWLEVVDATDEAPLFTVESIAGIRRGVATSTCERLRNYSRDEQFALVIIDNSADVFDGEENNRGHVRAFMRALQTIAPEPWRALLLLLHVDKGTSRQGKLATAESYSGSTAWHNAARSRLFLLEVEPGLLELQHQKCNVGPRQPDLRLDWPQGGIMAAQVKAGGLVASIESKLQTRALLRLVAKFNARGENLAPSAHSQNSAAKLLSEDPEFPKLKTPEAARILRDCERIGYLATETYKTPQYKPRERLILTEAGRQAAGLVPQSAGFPPGSRQAEGMEGRREADEIRPPTSGGL